MRTILVVKERTLWVHLSILFFVKAHDFSLRSFRCFCCFFHSQEAFHIIPSATILNSINFIVHKGAT
jgi:hypothetical protein